jgi:hypothetical protein
LACAPVVGDNTQQRPGCGEHRQGQRASIGERQNDGRKLKIVLALRKQFDAFKR